MIFLRHPTPDVEPGVIYGRTDLDIAGIGHSQIERALAETPQLTRIIASPALRCRKLAMSLAARDGIEPVFDARLWEMNMGDWEGLKWSDLPRELSDVFLADPVNRPTPGGECFADLQKRVIEVVEAHLDDELQTTGFVCHAGPIRAVQMAWHGISFREAFASTPPYSEPIRILPPGLHI